MKKRTISALFTALITISSLLTFAQSPPQAISWQTVVRDNLGGLVQNQLVSVRFDLHQSSATGTVVYSETHTDSTNEFGLLNLEIGNGIPVTGTFSAIDWSNGLYFTEILVDLTGGSNYVSMGAQQMMSVPYALFAEEARAVSGGSSGGGSAGIEDGWCEEPISMISSQYENPDNNENDLYFTTCLLYCDSLSEGGFTDWRVPTICEYNYTVLNPVSIPQSSTANNYHWTKTLYHGYTYPSFFIFSLGSSSTLTGNTYGLFTSIRSYDAVQCRCVR